MDRRTFVKALAISPLAATLAGRQVLAQQQFNLVVTGAGVEGYFRVIVETFNAILRDTYAGSAVTFKPNSPAGGLTAIAEGSSDISVAAGAPEILAAVNGEAPFKAPLKGKVLKVMRLHNAQIFHFLANKDWAEKNGIKSFADIAKKKPKMTVAINRKGNMQIVKCAEDILEAHGCAVSDIERWGGSISWVASEVGLEQLQDRKVDVFLNVRFLPDAAVADIAKNVGLVWLQADDAALKKVADKWGYEVGPVEPAHYAFVGQRTPTLVQWSGVLAGAHVPEENIYKFLKALFDNADRMRAIHPSMRSFSATEAVKLPKVAEFHPGALKYYREHKLL